MNSVLFMCMLLIGISSAASIVPFPNVYENIEQHEIIPFIKYHLMLGYSTFQPHRTVRIESEIHLLPRTISRIEQVPTPNSFDVKLFQWTSNRFGLSNDQVYKLARGEVICLPDGNCIEVGDVGSICCT